MSETIDMTKVRLPDRFNEVEGIAYFGDVTIDGCNHGNPGFTFDLAFRGLARVKRTAQDLNAAIAWWEAIRRVRE